MLAYVFELEKIRLKEILVKYKLNGSIRKLNNFRVRQDLKVKKFELEGFYCTSLNVLPMGTI